MSSTTLTKGAITAFFTASGDQAMPIASPTLQVLNIKKITSADAGSVDRYRLIISDGEYFMQAMLATQMNSMIDDGSLAKGTIIVLSTYQINAVQSRKIVIVLSIQSQGYADKIGQPQNIDTSGITPTPASAAEPLASAPVNTFQSRESNRPASTSHGASASTAKNVYPIRNLSPYQNKWTIKARVTQKFDVKTWSNARGEGKLFSVNLVDDSGEIKATAFKEQVDRLFPILQEGSVYYISRCRVNIAKPQFSNVQNEYELGFEADSEVIPCNEDVSSIPRVHFNFVPIADLANVEKDATIDIIGVAKETTSINTIVTKSTQKSLTKREVTLVDNTNFSVRLTLWGDQAESFNGDGQPILAIKGARVGDFNGRSISALRTSQILLNPDITEAHQLRGWFDEEGQSGQNFRSFASGASGTGGAGGLRDERKTFQQVVDENIGRDDKPPFYSVEATIMHFRKENASYPACPSDGCSKKVYEDGSGKWRCEKCSLSFPAPKHRYILSFNASDYTGQCWLQAFNDVAETVLGMSADALVALKDAIPEDDSEVDPYEAVFNNALFKTFIFRCRAKEEIYNEVSRIRHSVNSAVAVNPVAESERLIGLIQSYL